MAIFKIAEYGSTVFTEITKECLLTDNELQKRQRERPDPEFASTQESNSGSVT